MLDEVTLFSQEFPLDIISELCGIQKNNSILIFFENNLREKERERERKREREREHAYICDNLISYIYTERTVLLKDLKF